MRIVLPALAAACAVLPAAASAAEGDTGRMAEVLNDPARQAQLAAAAEAISAVLLQMPAAPLLRAAATMAGKEPDDIDPDTTVGDLAGPEAAAAPRELAQRMPQMMGAMAILASALEGMMPQLRERLAGVIPQDQDLPSDDE